MTQSSSGKDSKDINENFEMHVIRWNNFYLIKQVLLDIFE